MSVTDEFMRPTDALLLNINTTLNAAGLKPIYSRLVSDLGSAFTNEQFQSLIDSMDMGIGSVRTESMSLKPNCTPLMNHVTKPKKKIHPDHSQHGTEWLDTPSRTSPLMLPTR